MPITRLLQAVKNVRQQRFYRLQTQKAKLFMNIKHLKTNKLLSEEDAFILTEMMTGMFDPVFSDYSPATGLSLRSRMTHTYAAKIRYDKQ